LGADVRLTPHRREVFDVLASSTDHPTAYDILDRVKSRSPHISLATVYNCLDALVASGVIRPVQLERGATRYCANMEEHCHYYCDRCGAVFDVMWTAEATAVPRPKGFQVDHYEIAVHGICTDCARKK